MADKVDDTWVSGTIRGRIRPLRIGLLVRPSNQAEIRKAVRIASMYWAGRNFPLIPVLDRIAAPWDHLSGARRGGAKGLRDQYIAAYAPDLLVNLSPSRAFGDTYEGLQVVTPAILREQAVKKGHLEFGIGLNEVALSFAERELKYVRHDPIELVRHLPSGPSTLFLEALYGCIDKADWDLLFERSRIASYFTDRRLSLSSFYNTAPPPQSMGLGRLSDDLVSPGRRDNRPYQATLFAMDPASSIDIFDFWNLRALGWNVRAVPIGLGKANLLHTYYRDFVLASRRPPDRENGWWEGSVIIKGRSLTEADVKALVSSFALPRPPKGEGGYLDMQMWYPRIGEVIEGVWNDAASARLVSDSFTHDFSDARNSVRISIPSPAVAHDSVFPNHPRFACELYPSLYANKGLLAEVIPEGGEKVARCLTRFMFEPLRLTRRGPVALCRRDDTSFTLSLPLAEEVVGAWLEEAGITAAISSEGLVARAALAQIDGPWGATLLAHPGVLELIAGMSDGRHKTEVAIVSDLRQAQLKAGKKGDPKAVLSSLSERGLLRLGVCIGCDECGQTGWYSLEDLAYSLECSFCTTRMSLSGRSPSDLEWAYRAHGAFSAGNHTRGALPILLMLRFASLVCRAAVSPMLSFDIGWEGVQREVDLCLLYRDDSLSPEWSNGGNEVVFCECKHLVEFKEKDFTLFSQLRKRFPHAVFGFVSLREQLTPKELDRIRRFAQGGRKGMAESPQSPVFVLTKTELLHYLPPPGCWPESEQYRGRDGLMRICDETAHRYLGLAKWDDHRHAEIEKRQKKRAASQSTEVPMTPRDTTAESPPSIGSLFPST